MQIGLTEEVAGLVKRSAGENRSSLPQEANWSMEQFYAFKAKNGIEPLQLPATEPVLKKKSDPRSAPEIEVMPEPEKVELPKPKDQPTLESIQEIIARKKGGVLRCRLYLALSIRWECISFSPLRKRPSA